MLRVKDLRAAGLSRRDIKAAHDGMDKLTRGVYVASDLEPAEKHLLHCQAVLHRYGPEATLAGPSAALAWEIPLPKVPSQVYLRNISSGKLSKEVVRLPPGPSLSREGRQISPLDLTVADCARVLSARDALIAADGALNGGLITLDDLAQLAETLRNTVRVSRFRWVIDNADPLSESPGETWMRMVARSLGYSVTSQHHVVSGERQAWIDLLAEDGRTGLEFQGEIKYQKWGVRKIVDQMLRSGDLEAIGYRLLDFVWAQLHNESQFDKRMRYAGLVPTLPRLPIPW
jgi:hypothetical protein